MNTLQQQLKQFAETFWDASIIPALSRYIEIPAKSPLFDKAWQEHGYIDQAVTHMADWCEQQGIEGMQLKVHRMPGRTPLLILDIAGVTEQPVLMYGHLDKQPEMVGWHAGLGPWQPVIKDDKLYGRGGADDGYAVFAAIAAIKALQTQNLPHPRCIILIEASEESGSIDLPFYMETLGDTLGKPSLVIGLDSGMGDYEHLWITTSLRGLVAGVLTVEILTEGVHSGAASGIVPSSFRLLRQLLSRVEDEKTGVITLPGCEVTIPPTRIQDAEQVSEVLNDGVWTEYPWVSGAKPADLSLKEMILNKSWRSALSITGVAGIPSLEDAGNVLRPKTSLMLSLRTPPTLDPQVAALALKKVLEADPPHHAKVSFEIGKASPGWNAPLMQPKLHDLVNQASQHYFAQPALYWGEGGSIPFMHMLGEKFPEAQFIITGILGPHSNAHGPNEFLHIPAAKKLTACVAEILTQYAQ
ncbi:MAG: M20/M25/M40 family metallo-hydrolase [Gammaproteobacteria bacterium]